MNTDRSIPPQASDPNHKHVIASGARQSQIISRKSVVGSGAWTLRTCPPPIRHANPDAQPGRTAALRAWGRATSRAPVTLSGGGSWAEPLWKTAHSPQRRCASGADWVRVPFLRNQSDAALRLLDSGLVRLCPVSSGSGHVSSYSQTDRRVRLSGSLCEERSPHSRPLNRLLSWSSTKG